MSRVDLLMFSAIVVFSGLVSFIYMYIYWDRIKRGEYYLAGIFWSPNIVITTYNMFMKEGADLSFYVVGFGAWYSTFVVLFSLHRSNKVTISSKSLIMSFFMMLFLICPLIC